jgi:WD40 repeat protein
MGTGHNSSEILLWDITTQKISAVLEDENMKNVSKLDFSENGYHMISCSREMDIVNLWDLRKQEIIKSIEIPDKNQGIQNAEFDFIGKYIAISSGKNPYIFNTKTSDLINLNNNNNNNSIDCDYMKFDRDMEFILSVSKNGKMNVDLINNN